MKPYTQPPKMFEKATHITSPPYPYTISTGIGYFSNSSATTKLALEQHLFASSPLCMLFTICKTIYFFLMAQIKMETSH